MPRDPVMQKAHDALLKDGWKEFPGNVYMKASGRDIYLTLKAIPEKSWELSFAHAFEGVGTPIAHFEHLPEAAKHLTWG